MIRLGAGLLMTVAFGVILYGQATQPAFEVSSVKPALPGKSPLTAVRGGPGSSDPGLATLENIDLFSLVAMAYGISRYQLAAPDWMRTTRFDITARIAPGTSRDQYRLMLQNLLAERLQLALHHEEKEMQIYELAVAKNGSKLKESAIDPAGANDGLQPPPLAASLPTAGYKGAVAIDVKWPIARFATFISGFLGQPVVDATGLEGNYDIKLRALATALPSDTEATNSVPDLPVALQEQLGLRLVSRKATVDVLVIDHAEKAPIEN